MHPSRRLIDGLGITVYVDKVEPYTPPGRRPGRADMAITSDRPPREHFGITLCQEPFCPYEPVEGSVLPCGCHIQRGHLEDAGLCPEHAAALEATQTHP